jgi:hypothetical protein
MYVDHTDKHVAIMSLPQMSSFLNNSQSQDAPSSG